MRHPANQHAPNLLLQLPQASTFRGNPDSRTPRPAVHNPSTRALRIVVDLPNPKGKLLPGMYGTLTLADAKPSDR